MNEQFLKDHPVYHAHKLFNNIKRFHEENNRYPSSRDFNECPHLPSARQIQRRWGGLVALKKQLGIKNTDARKGKERTNMALKINQRNIEIEGALTKKLGETIDRCNIHHPYSPYDDSHMNIDYLIFHPTKKEVVGLELFFPSNKESFHGCLNVKRHKEQYIKDVIGYSHKFYYVVTNPDITQKEIDLWVSRRKSPLQADGVIHISEVTSILDLWYNQTNV